MVYCAASLSQYQQPPMPSSYLYVYQIQTPSETIVKVGHGVTPPELRMSDYGSTYGLEVIESSLKYWTVSDSAAAEKALFGRMKDLGYRNLKEGSSGPQELFQAPHGYNYQQVVEELEREVNAFEGPRDYTISDLVGAKHPPKKAQSRPTTNQVKHTAPSNEQSEGANSLLQHLSAFPFWELTKLLVSLLPLIVTLVVVIFVIQAASDSGITLKGVAMTVGALWLFGVLGGKRRRRKRWF